jgi:hypothetical protein
MKRVIIRYTDFYGEDITLYAVRIRKAGTREVSDGILCHNNRFQNDGNDYLSGGIVGMNAPENAEEADALIRLASWTSDFRIDGNRYYIFAD